MSPTILVTGASSGIGKACAELFLKRGWNVAATMRDPGKGDYLQSYPQAKIYRLDVTEPQSIQDTIAEVISDFGAIDAVLNNAGYGAVGVFESASAEQIRRQFDTNVFGVMSIISHILPHFRAKREGTILNVSSMGGKVTFPLFSLYHSSKFAVEGFSESLHYELRPLGIRIKLIEPGIIQTDFNTRSWDRMDDEALPDYGAYVEASMNSIAKSYRKGVSAEAVAETVFKAATDGSSRLRYAVGQPAPLLLTLRKLLPDRWFFGLIRGNIEKDYKA
jgi:NAD(P)-dependent dehydrogenase (short-subunit alcohol dehydrogenase family)